MKGFYLFLALFCSVLFVTGCSTDIAGVFDDNNHRANQRVLKEGKKVKLYAEIKRRIGIQTTTKRVFVALYPKLPDGEVEFVRWNNY